ncbi:MAG: hypothetical protein ACUVRD_05150 [Bacteroidia bacterium]
MMRLLGMGMVFFLACSPRTAAPKALPYPVTQPYCAVCKMSFYEYPIADTLTHQGKLYGFCSVECKKIFLRQHQLTP